MSERSGNRSHHVTSSEPRGGRDVREGRKKAAEGCRRLQKQVEAIRSTSKGKKKKAMEDSTGERICKNKNRRKIEIE